MPGRRLHLMLIVVALASLTLSPAQAGTAPSRTPAAERAEALGPEPTPGFRQHLSALAAGEGDATRHARSAMIDASLAMSGRASLDAEGCPSESLDVNPSVDLTGDGFVEVLQYDLTQDFCSYSNWSTKVTVLKGDTGTELWSRRFAGFLTLIPAGKLDSSGGEDLIAVETAFTDDMGPFGWSSRFTAVSGSTGSTIWTTHYQEFSSPTNDGYLDLSLAAPLSLSDATGDGVQDLLVGRYDVAYQEIDSMNGYTRQIVARFEVLSGSSGILSAAFSGTGSNAFPDAVYLPDASGDGQSDVAVISSSLGDTYIRLQITAFPGKGGLPLWRHEMLSPGTSPPAFEGAEVSGDGRGDLLVTSFDEYNDRTHVNAVIAGSELDVSRWTFVTDGEGSALAVPDVSGDGGEEVLVVAYQYEDFAFANLLQGSGAAPGSPAPLSLWDREGNAIDPVGDATDDGATDVLVWTQHYDPDTQVYYEESELVSGRDGGTVWSKVHSVDDYSVFIPMNADGNGNGTDDLLFLTWGSTDRYMLTDGATGSAVWSRPRDTGGWLIGVESAKLSGPGSDMFETVWDEDVREVFFNAVSGETGALLWTWS